LVGVPFAGPAQTSKSVPGGNSQIELSFAPLVRQAAPAVVNIYTRKVVRTVFRSPFLSDPFFRRFFGENSPFGRPSERIQNSLGSGVLVSPDGLAVTNHHVVAGADEIVVALADRREFAAELVLSDEKTDLAVLRIKRDGAGAKETFPFLEFRDSDQLEVGDLVLAIGNPFGVGQTVTSGIVSALARTRVGVADFGFFIQTDAAINPGNSGGALIGLDGRLVGINTAIYSKSGGSIGIGFAIPANMVRVVVEGASRGGKLVRPWLGASGQPVSAEIAEARGLDRPGGVLINEVHPEGPAKAAGLRVGDIVLAVNGQAVHDPAGLDFRIATRPLGGKAHLGIRRKGRDLKLEVALVKAPEMPPRNVTRLKSASPLAGVAIGNLSPAFAEELGIDQGRRGVIVLEVPRGSPASRLRFRPGDVLLRINGQDIGRVADVAQALKSSERHWRIVLKRNDQTLSIEVRG
jgi:serine protease Do